MCVIEIKSQCKENLKKCAAINMEKKHEQRSFWGFLRLDNLLELCMCTAQFMNQSWKMEYCKMISRLCGFIFKNITRLVGMGLLKIAWFVFICLQAGVGGFNLSMHKLVSILH